MMEDAKTVWFYSYYLREGNAVVTLDYYGTTVNDHMLIIQSKSFNQLTTVVEAWSV